MRRRWRAKVLAVPAVLVVSTTACQLRVGVDIALDRDGGGRLAMSVAADRELQQRADEAGVDPLGNLAGSGGELAAQGWRTSDSSSDDGTRTVTLSTAFADPAEFEALTADLAAALATDEVTPLEPLRLRIGPDRLRLDGAAGLEPTAAVADYGLTRRRAVRLLRRDRALDYTVTVTLPGNVLDSNASQQDGSRLRWTVAPGERMVLTAIGERPPPRWPPLVGGAVGVVLTIGGGWWLLRRRRSLLGRRDRSRS